MLGWQYNTVGVSDGITMGGEGMSKISLPVSTPNRPKHSKREFQLTSLSRDALLPPDAGAHRRPP